MMVGINLFFSTVCLPVIFLLRLRFPRNLSVADIIRRRYGDDVLRLQRKLESLGKKLQKVNLDLQFLTNCSDNGLIPHFLNFRLANPRLRGSNGYSACQRRLLATEIRLKHAGIRRLTVQLEAFTTQFRCSVSFLDFIHIMGIIGRSTQRSTLQRQEIHARKLSRLLRDGAASRNDPDQVIFNYSSHALTPEQRRVLARGLNFSVPPRKLRDMEYFSPFELLFRSVMRMPLYNGDLRCFKTRLKDTALSSFHAYNSFPPPTVLTRAETVALKELSVIPDLVIQKSDKGNSVVLLDRPDYVHKMNLILHDTSKFEKIGIEPGKELNVMFAAERRVRKVLDSVSKHEVFTSEKDFEKLCPSGSVPGRLYGLAKVHKPSCPLRPILSTIGTPTYNLRLIKWKDKQSLLRTLSKLSTPTRVIIRLK